MGLCRLSADQPPIDPVPATAGIWGRPGLAWPPSFSFRSFFRTRLFQKLRKGILEGNRASPGLVGHLVTASSAPWIFVIATCHKAGMPLLVA